MAKGEDTGSHPGRQVGPHLSPHWKSVQEGNWSGPMGYAFATIGPNDHGTSMTAWAGPEGHHAQVHSEMSAGITGRYAGMEHNRYVAGPYRTPARAQMAAESLASRVDSGRDASQYEKDSYVEYAKNPRYPS